MESSDKHFCKNEWNTFLNTKGKVHGNPKNNGSLFKLLGFHVGITFDVYVLLWWIQWNLLLSNLFAKNEILARKNWTWKSFQEYPICLSTQPHLQTHIMTLTRIFWCTQYNNKILYNNQNFERWWWIFLGYKLHLLITMPSIINRIIGKIIQFF